MTSTADCVDTRCTVPDGLDIVVAYEGAVARAAAEELAAELGGAACVSTADVPAEQLALRVGEDGLVLARDGMELRGDFSRMIPRLRQGALQRELLVKAARVKGVDAPTAVDATAGLGEDSLLLAAAGFEVTLCECDPVIAALLQDALRRSADDPQLASAVARMHVVCGDSKEVLRSFAAGGEGAPRGSSDGDSSGLRGLLAGGALRGLAVGDGAPPDVVYLDPMFPGRTKSAAVKKKFQLIHHLERPCDPCEEELLVEAALAAHPRKVVIKRPIKGAYLAGVKPSHSLTGKAVRYDCLVPPR